MKAEEIRNLVKQVADFEQSIAARATSLLMITNKITNKCNNFDRVRWDDCDDSNIYIKVLDIWGEPWTESFPIEYFADDFDLDAFEKQFEEDMERKKKDEEVREAAAQLEKERAEYERLKAKFERTTDDK